VNKTQPADLIEIYLRIQRQDIALIKFIFESYEGIGIVRTVDKKKATVVILVVPDFIAHARAILDSLREHMEWHEIPPPEVQDDWLMEKMRS
jgi:hypothetical protein